MKRTIITTAAICAAMTILAPAFATGVTTEFTGTGTWSGGTWSNGVPGTDDRAVIDGSAVCTVDTAAVADTIDVENGGVLNIGAYTLALDNDDGPTSNSVIDGTVYLTSASSVLRFSTSDHTITGSGSIVGQNNSAEIEIDDSRTMTSQITIEGALRIEEQDPNSESAIFVNQNLVHANVAGTLELATATIRDSTGDRWQVSTNASAVLKFSDDATGRNKLVGNFNIGVSASDNGTLDIDEDVTTSGTLDQKAGTTIDVASGKTFQVS